MPQATPNKLSAVNAHVQKKHRRNHHHFLVAALRSPFKMGAIFPSSRGLARAMATAVDVHKPGAVIELGAGTGVVTHALLKAGISPDRLVIIERDERLHAILSSHFHQLNIVRADAMHLDEVLADMGVKQVSAIVSSLPFLSMPNPVRDAIQHHMATLIGKDGLLIQFTYGPKSPLSAHLQRKHQLCGRRMKLVVANVPPAHVWVYHKERRQTPRA